jgi:penicillin-binding protein 1C
LGAGLFAAANLIFPLPNLALEEPDVSPIVLARDGTPMHVGLTPTEERVLFCRWDDLSPHLRHAAIAAEDRRFLEHNGVDARAVVRAAATNLAAGRVREGASTLTMQLARQLEPHPRTLRGKAAQAFRALQLEQSYDKSDLLLAYLNLVPLGGNLRGVATAATAWFGKRPRDLTAAESALLISMLPSPSRFRPDRDPVAARARRDHVLDKMLSCGFLDAKQHARAVASRLGLRPTAFPDLAPHAWLRAGRGGRTTIDLRLQRAVERLAVPCDDGIDGIAVLLIENESSAIRALVGAHQPSPRVLDCTSRPRSAGSTLKPLLYGLAFDLGHATDRTRLLDLPWSSPEWSPGNFDRRLRGPVPAGEALSRSLNLPAVRLAAALPRGAFVSLLGRAGFEHVRSPLDGSGIDLAIGTDDATPLELAAAYLALANGGGYARPVLRGEAEAPRRILSRAATALVTRALDDPRRARPDGAPSRGIAWKTGTSSKRRDAWAAGYTRRFTAVVWRGNLDGRPDARLVGARAAAPLLFAVLQAADPDPAPFEVSAGSLREVTLCAVSGLRAGPACSATVAGEAAGSLRECAVHQQLWFDRESGRLRCPRCRSGHPIDERPIALFPQRWAAWRRARGLAVPDLPPHADDCIDPLEPAATAPAFRSPREGQVFVATGRRAVVPVDVLTSVGQKDLRLLVDGRESGRPASIDLAPGEHLLTAIDGRDRLATVRILVRAGGPRR